MRTAIETVVFVAVLLFIGASDSVLASPLDRCEQVELQAALTMVTWQRGGWMKDTPLARDASTYPLYSHQEDQDVIVLVFSEKHRNQCRLEQHGITLNLPWVATQD